MRLLVIGAGSIGKRHLTNAVDLAEYAGIFDMDTAKAEAMAENLGAHAYSSLEDALADKPDGVIIAAPHKVHLSLATQVIESGADVLVEKPLSHTLDGVEELLLLADKLKRKVFVVCNMRFNQAVKALHYNLPRIGDIRFARAHFGNYLPNMRPDADYKKLYCAHKDQGGGVILDAIHEIDYLSWFFGDVKAVQCHAAKLSGLEIDVDDYASLIMEHESGVRSELHLDYMQQCKRRGCEIVGQDGTLLWQSEGKNPEQCGVRFYSAETKEWETLYEDDNLDMGVMYHRLMQAFVSEIKDENKTDLLDGRHAATSLKIVLAAYESADKGARVEC